MPREKTKTKYNENLNIKGNHCNNFGIWSYKEVNEFCVPLFSYFQTFGEHPC